MGILCRRRCNSPARIWAKSWAAAAASWWKTPNVIISRSAADLLFPGENPLDKQLRPAGSDDDTWYTVVGVVEDVLLDDFRRASPEPMVYLPAVSVSPAYVVKSTRADQLAPEVRATIREVMPESPMYRVFTMERLAANTMASLSFTMLMLGIAAALAVILGAVGLYGVLSYSVTQRTQEIGVRMALGAEVKAVRRMVVLQGATTSSRHLMSLRSSTFLPVALRLDT
ncbi:MAG: FtsX-like permease family protein [Luteitalea sp.]|nr:FtsX-like permease family protein [Luteitalea sp.]